MDPLISSELLCHNGTICEVLEMWKLTINPHKPIKHHSGNNA